MVEKSCSEYCQLRKSSRCRQANPPYAVHASKEWPLDRTPRSIRKRFPVSGTKVPDKPIPTDNKWASQCSWIWSTEHIQGPEARRPCNPVLLAGSGQVETITSKSIDVSSADRYSGNARNHSFGTYFSRSYDIAVQHPYAACGPRGRSSLDNQHSAPSLLFDIDRQLQNSTMAHGVRNPKGCRTGIQYANISTVAVCQSL